MGRRKSASSSGRVGLGLDHRVFNWSRDYLAELETIRDGLGSLEHVIVVGEFGSESGDYLSFEKLRQGEPIAGPQPVDPDGAALIGYTSGTTADPKGVVHTHRTIGCEVRQLTAHQSERDRANLTGARWGTPLACWPDCCVPWSAVASLFD